MDRGAWRATVHSLKKVDTTEVTEHARTHGNVGNGFLPQTEKQRRNVRTMLVGARHKSGPQHISLHVPTITR